MSTRKSSKAARETRDGRKLPRTFKELDNMLGMARSAAKYQFIHEHRQLTPGLNDSSVNTAANPRQDIVRALADLGQANAKITYSLMKALEVGK